MLLSRGLREKNMLNKLMLADFKKLLAGALSNLEKNKEIVNKLNVFPIPDGDTGTNMYLTLKTAIEEVGKKDQSNLKEFGKAVCNGALVGGRGNSGVILSQMLKGFFESIDDPPFVDTVKFASGLMGASKVAYQAVIKPVEGTMLTVLKAAATKAVLIAQNEQDFIKFLEDIIYEANEILSKTVDMLPELKEAGVIDAGGQGLVFLLEGGLTVLKGEEIAVPVFEEVTEEMDKAAISGDLKFKYDTVVLLNTGNVDPEKIKNDLQGFGDSIVVAASSDLTKVHIHSNEPYRILEYLVSVATIKEARIENMQLEVNEFLKEEKQEDVLPSETKLPFSIICVAQGNGFKKLFRNLGVETIIEGGQTMNPCINDILEAINSTKKENVALFPNNSNIVLAAGEAKKLSQTKHVEIIPTNNIVEAIPAILAFNSEATFEENIENGKKAIEKIHTVSITYSIRNTKVNGFSIKNGDIIAFFDHEIVGKGKNPGKLLMDILNRKREVVENKEFLGVYYGKDVTKEDAEKTLAMIQEKFPNLEIDLINGEQPFYYYLVSIE